MKPVKKMWKKSTVGKMVSGRFGPNKKAIKKLRAIAEKTGLGRGQINKVINRMCTKYSLDALAIKNPEKRKKVQKIMDKFGADLAILGVMEEEQVQRLQRNMEKAIGFTRAQIFFGVWGKKFGRIEKELEKIEPLPD